MWKTRSYQQPFLPACFGLQSWHTEIFPEKSWIFKKICAEAFSGIMVNHIEKMLVFLAFSPFRSFLLYLWRPNFVQFYKNYIFVIYFNLFRNFFAFILYLWKTVWFFPFPEILPRWFGWDKLFIPSAKQNRCPLQKILL